MQSPPPASTYAASSRSASAATSTAPAEAGVWAAPVHRGLYDEVWAADERVRIEQRLAVAAHTRERLEANEVRPTAPCRNGSANSSTNVPAGHLDTLAATAAELRSSLRAATTRRTEIAAESAALGEEDAKLDTIAGSLEERVRTATDNAGRCEEQARRDRQAAQWQVRRR